ncbi:hypothetical protein CEXT_686811 [Caerostris extrusa]|uniref:Uncharacterized protein n=1 Tax=Caerostris extrusa TaxID=172846 RepID=A0AAV4TAL4_CAEEX|nr:hypothetical protein CEXT_686811 [Caerostris extrusa]
MFGCYSRNVNETHKETLGVHKIADSDAETFNNRTAVKPTRLVVKGCQSPNIGVMSLHQDARVCLKILL